MIIAHTDEGNIELRCNQLLTNGIVLTKENSILVDLLNIFLEIYVFDIGIKRSGKNPRLIELSTYIDFSNMEIWEENRKIIDMLTNFVTDGDQDKWKVNFIPCEYEFTEEIMDLDDRNIDNVSLISGGLDSFCGAYLNEVNNLKTLYCGYKTSNVDTSAIARISNVLHNREGNAGIVTYSKVDVKKVTFTQRTRSLLFFSLAVITAVKEKVKNINVNENGIMTLNPSFQTRGTTKTTHPKTIYLYQSILTNAGINVKINHPFLFMTKGEMVGLLSDEFINYIKDTRSCSRSLHNPLYDTSSTISCGTCVPCLLRKISMSAYDMEKYDNEYIVPYSGNMNDEEYRSSIYYFQTFYQSIKSNQIFSELIIKDKYYKVNDYLERTYKMLNTFALEIEKYMKKYDG